MRFGPKKMSPEILKAFSLSSALSAEDQIRFLDLLISVKSRTEKEALIEQALTGERVWEKKVAV
jgi:hypothetical protein